MKSKKKQVWFTGEKGNTFSLVVVLLLCMTLLATASVTLARTQLTMSGVGRKNANSYYLARSGAEKIVDSMNKEIATELPSLMEEATKITHEKMLKIEGNKDGVIYKLGEGEEADPYSGKYIGRDYENEYEVKLRQLIYNHIIKRFVNNPKKITGLLDYVVYSDAGRNVPIKITTKIYNRTTGKNPQVIPEDIKKVIEKLATEDEVGTSDKDTFVVEIIAMKSRVIGTIALDQQVQSNEELLEEYVWAAEDGENGIYPEALQSAIVSFGDFVDISIFKEPNQWSYNNPIYVGSTSETIDISEFKSIPTAIVCTDEETTITLTSSGKAEFNGIIITPGKVNITSDIIINGVIIAGYEYVETMPPIEGIQDNDMIVNYDRDMILKLRFMDKSLQRKLYDSLKITNYKSSIDTSLIGQEQDKINVIMGKKDNRMIRLSPTSVISSKQGGLQFVMKSLRKL